MISKSNGSAKSTLATAAALALFTLGAGAFAQAPAAAYEPAPTPAAAPVAEQKKEEKPLVGYEKGFYLAEPKGLFKLVINGRVQGRFTFDSPEAHKTDADGNAISATERPADEYKFNLPQVRLKLSGHVFSERVTYNLQPDFGNKGMPALITAFGDFALVPKALHVRVGQWERPFSRQQITSSGSFRLVDRAITDKAFGAGRDIGVALHNDYEKSPKLEWVLGLFNGTGDKPWFEGGFEGAGTADADGNVAVEGDVSKKATFTNSPEKLNPAIVGRIGFNTGGIKSYSEADLEGGPFRLGVAASAQLNFDADGSGDALAKGDLDFILKAHGFSIDGAVYVLGTEKDGGSGFADVEYAAWGLHAQAGYLILGHVEPVVRYALVDPKDGDNNTQEILGGIGVYFFQHNVKWISEAGPVLTQDPAGGLAEVVVRSQLQLAF